MAKEYKLDLFTYLNNLSRKNSKFYNSLSDDEKKEISPLIIMRWLSGTSDARQVFFLNELVNPFVFTLGKHKELLNQLMSLCTSGKQYKYNFIKAKSKKTTSTPKSVEVIKEYFHYSTLEAMEALLLISNEDVLSFAEQLGKQPPEIATIKKELKTRLI